MKHQLIILFATNETMCFVSFIKTTMTLHESVFLPVILFNSAVWTNLAATDIKKLQTIQLKYLKRIVRAPYSTPNAFVFLEYGVLPIEYLIHIRQLTFLHHITHLDQNDPVFVMFKQQQQLPYEKNWTNHILNLLRQYNIQFSEVETSSKDKWKLTVKSAVRTVAFHTLTEQIASKSKTQHLEYLDIALQPYLLHYTHKQASTIFKIRSRSTECKQNRKSANDNMLCRLCETSEETQTHVTNCPVLSPNGPILDLNCIMGHIVPTDYDETMEICSRFNEFSKQINTCTYM